MKLLLAGACGFVGSVLTETLLDRCEGLSILGLDSLLRPGSETNRVALRQRGVTLVHGDIRSASDLECLPAVDWVIDAAANPSVLAGMRQGFSSRQLFEHNLAGTVNLLEYAKQHRAGFILLSSSRVYSIPALCAIPLQTRNGAYVLDAGAPLPAGVTRDGIGRGFSTAAPVSLYGAAKLACETMALEYGDAFGFPVWVNRCGVLAGAGQFGTPDQGIFSYWIHAHRARRPLRYLGFDGSGKQVRDAFHPRDLAGLIDAQMRSAAPVSGSRTYAVGGGPSNAMSLANLTAWCDDRFGAHAPAPDPTPRLYDVPWVVMDSGDALRDFGWTVETPIERTLDEIAVHAANHPDWLERSGL
jgi:CDP-paratose 2-epimerase